MVKNILWAFLSSAVCLFAAKIAFGLLVDRTSEQKAILGMDSTEVAVQYSDPDSGVIFVEYVIANHGDKRLLINAKEFDCQCYLGDEGSLRILPGKTARLRIPLSSEAIKYRSKIDFTLQTNDPEKPEVGVSVNIVGGPDLCPKGATSVMHPIGL